MPCSPGAVIPWASRTPRPLRSFAWAVALLLLGPLLGACGGGGGGGGAAVFVVTSTDPVANAQFVPVQKVIRVLFSRAVDPASVTEGTITVTSPQTSQTTPGVTTVDAGTQGLVWVPDQDLPGPLLHVVRIDPGLRSTSGDPVGGSLEFRFTTAAPSVVPGLPDPRDLRNTTNRLRVGRRSHRATLLGDGSVLVTGGFRQAAFLTDRAEIFDPDTEFFTELPARMTSERAHHTATLLDDGRVLLCGGWVEAGIGRIDETATAEVYVPATRTFVPVGSMGRGRVDHAAFRLPDGRVLVTGGSRLDTSQSGDFLVDFDDAEVFDPVTNAFAPHAASMSHTRSTHGMVAQGTSRVVLAGGSDADLRSEILDLASGAFTALAPVVSDRARFGAAMEGFGSGGVAVAGGDDRGTVVYVFPDGSRATSTGSGLTQPRSYATATRLGATEVLVAGGIDLTAGSFITASTDLLREGGVGGCQTFATSLRFPVGMAFHTATPLGDGRILFCGSLNPDGTSPELDVAYVYDPR